MTKEEKNQAIDALVADLESKPNFYLADISNLNAEDTYKLRSAAFKRSIGIKVVKNTLLKKAMEKATGEYDGLYEALKGNTSIMFSETGNAPAKLIKEFRKKSDRPLLKGAWVGESIYLGDSSLSALEEIKSKEEVIGDIIGLLQSPAKNVISALQTPGRNIAGILQTLAEKGE
ncbi:MAG: 50S ribosomal protein L10 [Flavobacteriales bacterium]|nr:50S ribosomal protein L10 [Flavobacteriales bacterium]